MSDCIDLTSDTDDQPEIFSRNRYSGSSDVELVEDEPVRAEAAAAAAPAAGDGEDVDDFVITKAVGDVATIDYPHSRCDCGQHAFLKKAAIPNSLYCHNCYCFVCDCKAAECKSWGTGAGDGDHCNAYGNATWLNLRKAHRRGGAVQKTIANCVAQPAARTSAYSTAAVPPRRPQPYSISHFAVPQPPPASAPRPPATKLKPLPNPAETPNVVELGTIRLACKAAGGHTIGGLASKLARYGLYVEERTSLYEAEDDSLLCLSKLFKFNWDSHGQDKRAVYCALKPFVDPEIAQRELMPYLQKMTFVHYDGLKAPMTYGVRVTRASTAAEVLQEAANMMGAVVGPHEVLKLVHVYADVHDRWPPWRVRVYADTDKLEKTTARTKGFYVYRVPKPAATNPVWAAVFHKLLPTAFPTITNDEHVGIPFLVPLSPADVHGGSHAHTVVTRAVLAYMRAFPATDHSMASLVKIFRHEGTGWMGKPPPGLSFSRHKDGGGYRLEHSAVLRLVAGWKKAPPITSLAAFNTPPLHESASPAAMRETERHFAEDVELESQKMFDAALAERVLSEIMSASKRSLPKTNKKGNMEYVTEPSIAYDMTLEADAGSDVDGVLTLKLFSWTKPERNQHKTIFQDFEQWSTGTVCASICDTMHLLARQSSDSARKRLLAVSKHKWSQRHRTQSIKGLLDAVQNGNDESAEHPAGLTVTLQPYQLQSLKFMQDMEDCDGGFRGRFWVPMRAGNSETFWYSPFFERVCRKVPAQPCGGFLAEEMGLGKTVEMLALVVSRPPPATFEAGKEVVVETPTANVFKFTTRATLVVCAVSLAGQWMMEAKSKVSDPLRVHMYHGHKAQTDPYRLATEFDFVVTTYGMVKDESALMKVKWYRIIFDECHTLKQHTTRQTQMCTALDADRRWLCSGTPINKDVTDLYGQLCAMRLSPLDKKSVFDSTMKPNYMNVTADLTKAYIVLSELMVRHTKAQVSSAMKLPPKSHVDVPVVPTETEVNAYNKVFRISKSTWTRHKALGPKHVSTHLFTIMALLQPLRRICSGGDLTPGDLTVNTTVTTNDSTHFDPNAIPSDASLVVPEDVECSICLDNMESPVCTPCGHWFCQECITSCLSNSGKCPMCRTDVVQFQLRTGVVAVPSDASGSEGSSVTVCNSKLRTLLQELTDMQQQDPEAKALVFTQYRSAVMWLQPALEAHGFPCYYITGDMTARKREKAIEAFQNSNRSCVFLLSMRTGAVGINLTAANFVFILEPFLNLALEEQAVGRAWRMGQKREVTVKRFYIQGSVEQRIIDIAAQKSAAEAAAQAQQAADEEDSEDDSDGDEDGYEEYDHFRHMHARVARARGRRAEPPAPKATGIVGCITTEKQNLRVEELTSLFEEPTFPDPLPSDTPVAPVVPEAVKSEPAAEPAAASAGPSSQNPLLAAAAAAAAAASGSGAASRAQPAAVQDSRAGVMLGSAAHRASSSGLPGTRGTTAHDTVAAGFGQPSTSGGSLPAGGSHGPQAVASTLNPRAKPFVPGSKRPWLEAEGGGSSDADRNVRPRMEEGTGQSGGLDSVPGGAVKVEPSKGLLHLIKQKNSGC